METPLISVLIVNYNGLRHLQECLSSLRNQQEASFEIILVDNASVDGSADWIKREFPEINLIVSQTNLGFAGGNNLGLPKCNGRFVFFLNNDTRIETGALSRLTKHIRDYPENVAFSCCLLQYNHPDLIDSAGDTLYTNGVSFCYRGYPASDFSQVKEVASACGGGAIYPRRILEELNGFDEDFFLIFEDIDLSFRARHAGYRVLFLPDVRILHKGSASIGGHESRTSLYYSERNSSWVYLKNYPILVLTIVSVKILVMKIWRFIPFLRHGHAGVYFRANFDSLLLFPKMLRKRKSILSNSRISSWDFYRQLRKNWVRDRIRAKLGKPGR